MNDQILARWIDSQRDRIARSLIELVNLPTVTPNEAAAYEPLAAYVRSAGLTPRIEDFPADLDKHLAYTDNARIDPKVRRANVRADFDPPGAARKVTFNTHFDVVPAGADFPDAFAARVEDGAVVGRGASDSKGHVVMVCEAVRFLREAGIPIRKRIGLDFVIEEEVGGNGTLACIVNRCDADEIIVLEGTELNVYNGHRGCLSFKVDLAGRAAHMGEYLRGVSAIDKAFAVIARLKELEARFMAEARTDPYFSIYEGLTPVLIGQISGGDWFNIVPRQCSVTGSVGFLPRYTIGDIKQMLVEKIETIDDPWIREHYAISYPALKNEAFLTDESQPVVRDMLAASRACGGKQDRPYGWKVSCDARLYSRVAGKPTVIFGCGALTEAHTNHERLPLERLFAGMKVLAQYLSQ